MLTAELIRSSAHLKTFVRDTAPLHIVFDAQPLPVSRSDTPADSVMATRPDVRAARGRLEAATAGIPVERALVLREINATLGIKRSAGNSSLLAGVSLPFPLLSQNRGEIARASAERDIAAFELDATQVGARAELRAAQEATRILTQQANALASGFLVRAEEARRITMGAYREGALPLLNVIDAARAWGEARRTYYQMLFAQHESVLELFVAQGGDLANWQR
jgi:cobalt-zinc-cadmium efflux system outer membrane protein